MLEIRPTDYVYKTEPYAKQKEAFLLSRDEKIYALFMEQGTGKTKVIIDTAAYQYSKGRIDCLLVVAPKGVHMNWVTDEVPKHLPDYIPHACYCWRGKDTKKDKTARQDLFKEEDKLIVVCVNVDVFSTKNKALPFIKKILETRRVLFVVDESTRIKNHSSKRTKVLINYGKKAVTRRILTGTPITQSPLDLFGQFSFLDAHVLGFSNYHTFKHYYAVWREQTIEKEVKGPNGTMKKEHTFEVLVGHTNTEELVATIDPYSFRCLKSECVDLPPKIYQTWSVELGPEQKRQYKQLEKEFILMLEDTTVTVIRKLTLLLRLHQIAGGFIKTDDGQIKSLESTKISAFKEIIEDYPGKMIVWCRFREEIRAVCQVLKEQNRAYVEYHGDVNLDDRELAKTGFQNPGSGIDYFVGNAHAGGIGLTLTACKTMVYYSNDFSLETRLQSEDRAHRIGLEHPVTYVDILAEDTIDMKIIKALKQKKNYADLVTGDQAKDWL